MIFAGRFSRHERSVLGRLRLLGLEGERTIVPRHDFRAGLRDQLVAEALQGRAVDGRCVLSGC